MNITVTVCLCTFKRPSVRATLTSIANQVLPKGVAIDVVVVDSDLRGSAQALIAQVQELLPIAIRYIQAERTGVAEARNKAVSEATGDWLAFIDDDEEAEPHWLATLLSCAEQSGAKAVFGAVYPLYPQDCPDWIRKGDFFERSLPPTGTRVKHGPTGNTLLARSAIEGLRHVFDVAYGTTGGEDTELFHRLSQQGITMVTCREAIVNETVELHRLNRTFLMRKAVRVGETYFRIFFANAKTMDRLAVLAKASAQCLAAGGLAVLLRPFGLGYSMKFQVKAAANFGKLRAAAGHAAVELYKG